MTIDILGILFKTDARFIENTAERRSKIISSAAIRRLRTALLFDCSLAETNPRQVYRLHQVTGAVLPPHVDFVSG